MEEHKVEKIISEMLNSLVHSRDPHPVIFMVSIANNKLIETIINELFVIIIDQISVKSSDRARTRRAWDPSDRPSTSKDSNNNLSQI